MKIRGANEKEILDAVEEVSRHYGYNVIVNALAESPRENCWRITLGVARPEDKGALFTRPEVHGRPVPTHTACWHVHKHFFEALPFTAFMKSIREANQDIWIPRDGGHFDDYVVGDRVQYWLSDLCECEHDRSEIPNRSI